MLREIELVVLALQVRGPVLARLKARQQPALLVLRSPPSPPRRAIHINAASNS